jgi:hypothetical protein
VVDGLHNVLVGMPHPVCDRNGLQPLCHVPVAGELMGLLTGVAA